MDHSDATPRFYRLLLPPLVAINLLLGVANLLKLQPRRADAWIGLLAGAVCCSVAGWLLGIAQARAFWRAAAERQRRRWQRLVEVLLKWIELAPFEAADLRRIRSEAEDALGRER